MKKMKMIKLWLAFAVIALLALAFTACNSDSDDEDTMYYGDPVETEATLTCPLDGEEIEDSDDVGDYLFIVAIENGPGSEPQSGIGDADLLIEIPAEGGINRFLAFYYHHTPDTIGGVRSARHYFYDIVDGYDAIFAHCGGSPQAYDVIDSGREKDMDEFSLSSSFHRVSSKSSPHNLYTSYDELSKGAEGRGYDQLAIEDCPAFSFYDAEELENLDFGGVSEFSLNYRYKEVSYRWHEDEEAYLRYSKGDLHMDDALDEAVSADNVVVLYVENHVIDGEGRLDMDIDSGEGELLQNGSVTSIRWDLSDGEGFSFRDAASGETVKLIPGRTIIQIASPDLRAVYEDGDDDEEDSDFDGEE